jgi:hypothetical protein
VASQLLHQIEIATGLETLIDPLVPTAVESLLGRTVALSVKLRTIAGKPLYKAFGTSVEFGQKVVAGPICFCAIVDDRPELTMDRHLATGSDALTDVDCEYAILESNSLRPLPIQHAVLKTLQW